MLDSFKKIDFLSGMLVKRRDGMTGRFYASRDIITFGTSFIPLYQISDDLTYVGPLFKGEEEKGRGMDLVRVSLPSGAVLWERKEESPDQTKDRRCRDCARLKTSDLLCARCLRGGHETDVDFYLPTGGHVNEKE